MEQTFLFSLFKRKYKISLSLRYNKIQKLEINFKVYYYPDTVFFSSVFCFLPLMHLRRNITVFENHQISLIKDNQHAKKKSKDASLGRPSASLAPLQIMTHYCTLQDTQDIARWQRYQMAPQSSMEAGHAAVNLEVLRALASFRLHSKAATIPCSSTLSDDAWNGIPAPGWRPMPPSDMAG